MPLVSAQVRDWGPGQPADLGSLQVESFAPGDDPADDAKPFADVLARRLEWLQVCAQPTPFGQAFPLLSKKPVILINFFFFIVKGTAFRSQIALSGCFRSHLVPRSPASLTLQAPG